MKIYQAITVKYLGPTETKGTRFKAFAAAGSLVESRDYEYEVEEQVINLAKKFIKKYEWDAKIVGCGVVKNGDYVFVLK